MTCTILLIMVLYILPIRENPGNPILMNESVQQENQQFGSFDSFSALLSLSLVLRFYFVSSEPSQMAGASDEALP